MGYSIFDETMVDMAWPEIEAAAKQGAIVLLPTGIIEEHGPHMGLAVDTYSAYLIARLVKHELEKRGTKSLIAPLPYWGVSAATSVFPGTFSVRPETLKALIYDILASLHSWNFNKVFVIHWHGDVQHCLSILDATKDGRRDMGIDARNILTGDDLLRLHLTGSEEHILLQKGQHMVGSSEKYVDIHAGSMETAVMMKYFPKHVKADLTKKLKRTELTFTDLKGLGKSEAETRKLIPQGYFGNPAGYDTKAAEKLIRDDVVSAADCIEEYLKSK